MLHLLALLAPAENYVVFEAQQTTNQPPASALAAYVLQHTMSETSALGRYVWRFGGLGESTLASNELWMLDMQSSAWTERSDATGAVPTARRGATLSLRGNSAAYLFGGETAGLVKLQDMHALDIGLDSSATPAWQAIATGGTVPTARSDHTATVVNLHSRAGEPLGLLVFGGVDDDSRALDDLHEFDYALETWSSPTTSGVPPAARKGHAAARLLEDTVAVVGGTDPAPPDFFMDVHLYDVKRAAWSTPAVQATVAQPPVGRAGHTMLVIGDEVYIFGGLNRHGAALDDVWSFNAISAAAGQIQWEQPIAMSSLPTARWGHTALLSIQSALIFGGLDEVDAPLGDVWEMRPGCGGNLTLTASHATFSDGEGDYWQGMDCMWIISPAIANANVMLILSEFELTDEQDRLRLYDGDSLAAPEVGSYTGNIVPASVTSSASTMLVRFTSKRDGGSGFTGSYQAVCAAGYTWNEVSSLCEACPAGYYAAYPNLPKCESCPKGFYSDDAAATACAVCPTYATTPQQGAQSLDECTCQRGYVGLDNHCDPCPQGATCPGGNVLRAADGWCQDVDAATGMLPSFAHCCESDDCPGGAGATCDDSVALVGDGNDCAVRYLSWDTINQVSLSVGTWCSFVAIGLLLFTISLLSGGIMGWRLARGRFKAKIDPSGEAQPLAAAPPDHAGQQQQPPYAHDPVCALMAPPSAPQYEADKDSWAATPESAMPQPTLVPHQRTSALQPDESSSAGDRPPSTGVDGGSAQQTPRPGAAPAMAQEYGSALTPRAAAPPAAAPSAESQLRPNDILLAQQMAQQQETIAQQQQAMERLEQQQQAMARQQQMQHAVYDGGADYDAPPEQQRQTGGTPPLDGDLVILDINTLEAGGDVAMRDTSQPPSTPTVELDDDPGMDIHAAPAIVIADTIAEEEEEEEEAESDEPGEPVGGKGKAKKKKGKK